MRQYGYSLPRCIRGKVYGSGWNTEHRGALNVTKLTEIEGGAEFTASDEEIREALEEASEELGMSVEELSREVAYILDSGTGVSNNEGVGGVALSDNPSAQKDPRLEALELYKLRKEI